LIGNWVERDWKYVKQDFPRRTFYETEFKPPDPVFTKKNFIENQNQNFDMKLKAKVPLSNYFLLKHNNNVYHLELTPKSDEEMNIFYEEDGVK
jgi:hypothetical protein